MKVLILGATGMAGHTIAIFFKEKGHFVDAISRKPFLHTRNIIGDVFDNEFLKITLQNGNYDAVVNCIGILNQDAEINPSTAVYLNSYLPHKIAQLLSESRTKLVHLSTDCVFAGNTGPYFENSFCDGQTFYDRSKALGEVNDNKNLTFRNSIIGPDLNEDGIGLFNWFMKQKEKVHGYKGAIWTGVTTLTLAKAIEAALEQNLTGLYQLVNNESISKFELLNLFNKYFKSSKVEIENNFKIQLDKSLRNTRNDFNFSIPSYNEMIIEMKDWIFNHQFLYKHY
jgi:dTDP-4-dehydrorhamnose reductase